jgi:hypothetical protein
MKTLTILDTPERVHAYCRSLWRTDLFRASHDAPDGYIRTLITAWSAVPRCFADMDDPWTEKAHFSPWWNVIARRDYANPAIHDLFYLHEIAHCVHMTYDGSMTFEPWLAKMIENEARASLESEVLVYGALPGLRAMTFPHEIWADRFLGDRPLNPAILLAERLRAVTTPRDDVERQLSLFGAQNRAWGEIWRTSYPIVESQMASFLVHARADPGGAIAQHRAWLAASVADAPLPYPFAREAHAFARIYWSRVAELATMSDQPEPDRIAPPVATV